ncbi:MAG TPA: DEAD/DEAH box helicase, partial [Gemmatimonadales bacterium]
NVVEHGRNVLHRLYLGPNEILQMAGRVHGRVRGGEVAILSDRDLDFASLRPGPPEFQLAGDAERVALTCAELGVDAGDLDLPVPLDRQAYRRAVDRLTHRGLIEAGRLTRYGREVEALPVERTWAELLVHADTEQLPLVAGASGIDSLHRMTREERDLHGVLVAGSDHLTAYNLLAEAVNSCGRIGEVHGLRRHVFDEVPLAEWAERRGVLVKAIEDGALGMAAAYRALDAELPDVLPPADHKRRTSFVDLVARIEPFDLVLDEQTADGQPVRIAKTSVAGSWGAVAGTLRYFADRFGVARASIDGTTLPYDLIRKYAVQGPAAVMLNRNKHRQELGISQQLHYFGFDVERTVEPLRGEIPPAFRDSARTLLANGLLAGDIDHPSRQRLSRALESLDEYWRRSGGVLANVDRQSVRTLIRDQLEDVSSWEEFQRTPVHLDLTALVPPEARAHLDALPGSLHLRGDAVSLEYEVREGQPLARVYLREGQARRLRPTDLPVLDRPLVFAVRRRGDVLQAETLGALQQLLQGNETNPPAASQKPPKHHPAKHHGSRGMRGRGPRGRPRR